MDLGGLAKDLFQLLQSGQLSNRLVDALGDQRAKELKRLVDQERSERPPKVAVVGKAGVGKTTTVNNLFSASFRTSHALTGTKEAQLKEYELQGGGLLHVLDLPGLGEGVAEDEAFEQIYRNELPHTDLVLYVLEAGERILGEDQRILRDVIIPSLSKVKTEEGRPRRLPIIVGLNKVDDIGPGKWDEELNYPSEAQERSIERRCRDIARKLRHEVKGIQYKDIVYYSAERRFRLPDLLLRIVRNAGDAAWKLPLNPRSPWELASPEVQDYVQQYRQRGPRDTSTNGEPA